jgi:hypothetical protein
VVKQSIMSSKDKIDEKFDKIEKVLDRSKSLALKVIGTILAICLAVYAGLDQLAGDEEYYDEDVVVDSLYEDSTSYE